jgi:hypothetical protein
MVRFGQYLHFVADLAVHPNDPLIGHGIRGHDPDRADLHADKMRIFHFSGSSSSGELSRQMRMLIARAYSCD